MTPPPAPPPPFPINLTFISSVVLYVGFNVAAPAGDPSQLISVSSQIRKLTQRDEGAQTGDCVPELGIPAWGRLSVLWSCLPPTWAGLEAATQPLFGKQRG